VQKTGDGLRAKHGAIRRAVGGKEGRDAWHDAELKAPRGADGLGNAWPQAARGADAEAAARVQARRERGRGAARSAQTCRCASV
jgi:hypothetical protein